VEYNLAATEVQRDGHSVIAVAPQTDYSGFFMVVRPETKQHYLRSQVVGVVFWLSGGSDSLQGDDLAITALGSNAYPYWRCDDGSVRRLDEYNREIPLFSETRLYWLGIRNAIPPDTWVEVVLWLDDRLFDPNFNYLTGLYFKNDAAALKPYYLDDIRLLISP
jgi:hypothetical protein